MKSVLIIKKDSAAKNDLREKTIEVVDLDEKKKIIEELKLNIQENDIQNYQFFLEDELYKSNTFYKDYANTLFEVYFPSHYDTKTRKNLYYLKPAFIQKDKLNIYVYEWENVDIPENTHIIHFINEKDNFEQDCQRILILITE